MVITKQDLKNMYLEHLNAEKIRLERLIDEEIKLIIKDIIDENKLGKQNYRRKCYELREDYLTMFFTKLQEVFVDIKISTEVVSNPPINNFEESRKHIVIIFDWS